ncbi:hypothetical protein A2U01_0112335, partial [Trifolium medium]|nr:hypothetical protein [Trifolium medium]
CPLSFSPKDLYICPKVTAGGEVFSPSSVERYLPILLG